MKVVVTGASSPLGSRVVALLLAEGHEVDGVTRADVDLRSDDAVATLAARLGADVALAHLAALHPIDPATTIAAERRELLDVNVHGTMRVLQACRDARVRRIVFASTTEVVGSTEGEAVDETSRTAPLSDFAAMKLSCEDHLRVLHEEAGIGFVALRLAALYGPGVRPRAGVAAMIEDAARGGPPRLAGRADDAMDVLFLDDAARAVVLALETTFVGIVAVGDGVAHRAVGVARAVMAAAGVAGEPVIDDAASLARRPRYHTRIDRARRELGFTPTVSLDQGISRKLASIRAPRS